MSQLQPLAAFVHLEPFLVSVLKQEIVVARFHFRSHTLCITARYLASTGDENARSRSRLPLTEWSSAMQQQQRRRFAKSLSLEERLAEEARCLREEAELLPQGALREEVLRKARQAETGSHVNEWLRSPGLRPPQ